ncbi:hypothetical protein MRX96_045288 [Rhipicephalus microplus]
MPAERPPVVTPSYRTETTPLSASHLTNFPYQQHRHSLEHVRQLAGRDPVDACGGAHFSIQQLHGRRYFARHCMGKKQQGPAHVWF